MVPAIANNGSSFKGAAAYYLHDKFDDEGKPRAQTRDRVAWTHTENLPSNNPDTAWKVMAFTAKNSEWLKQKAGVRPGGRKHGKTRLLLSASPGIRTRNPDQDHMLKTAQQAVAALGLSDHQTLFMSHKDEPQKHVHVIINRVHPETGVAAPLSNTKKKLQEWALHIERHAGQNPLPPPRNQRPGARIQCPRPRAGGEAEGATSAPAIPSSCRPGSARDSGKAFAAALEVHGYRLAQGNKRVVVVDKWGKTHNPLRHLNGVKAKDLKARLSDINISRLPRAEAPCSSRPRSRPAQEYRASRKFDAWSDETHQ